MARIQAIPFLFLLFVGTVCNSMIVPFMGFFIVDGLGMEPWTISIYAGAVAVVVILANRAFAKRLDGGAEPFPMIGIAVIGFLTASAALSLSPSYWTAVTLGVAGFGAASSAMSTMFNLGAVIAERNAVKRSVFNAYMRATTSTAWMVGPALSFVAADQLGDAAVFRLAFVAALLWLGLWWWTTPRDAAKARQTKVDSLQPGPNWELRAGISFVFCLALAHSLTFSALPVFFVQEVGLPGHAPGMAFSLKTFIELFAIALTPYLAARFGLRRSLIATALFAVVAIQVLASVQTLPQMLAGAALEGFYFGLFSTLAITFVQSLSKDRPAYATALYWNTMMVTLVIAGPAAGFIAQASDFQTVIVVGSGLAVVSTLILAFTPLRWKSEPT